MFSDQWLPLFRCENKRQSFWVEVILWLLCYADSYPTFLKFHWSLLLRQIARNPGLLKWLPRRKISITFEGVKRERLLIFHFCHWQHQTIPPIAVGRDSEAFASLIDSSEWWLILGPFVITVLPLRWFFFFLGKMVQNWAVDWTRWRHIMLRNKDL